MTNRTEPTKETIAVGAFLSAMHDQGLDGAKVREAMLDVLVLSATLQAREGEAVANSAILARGRFHAFKGEDGEPDDWEWFEEGTNCEHGCIDAVIVRADAIAAPQPAQPDHIADTNKMVPADHVEQHLDMVEQPEQVDWKDQYEKQKRRAEMWIAKYEKDIGPLEKVYPAAQPEQGEREEVIELLKQGAAISRDRGINLDFAKIADRAANLLQSAQPVAQPLTDDPLQGAVDWLLQADGEYFCVATVQRTLRIGYNRAKRLADVAKERAIEAAHGIGGAL